MRQLLVALVFFLVVPSEAVARGPLAIPIIIIDPGHGGKDPGANGLFNSQEVFESEYVYDVAKRIERVVRQAGGGAVLTTRKRAVSDRIRDNPPSQVLEREGSEIFALDGSTVKAGRSGLRKRTGYANQLNEKYRGAVIFVSIHFDALPRSETQGMRIITPDERAPLALAIAYACRKRLRAENPVVASGDRNHGMRDLFILRESQNQVKNRILVELGNFANLTDVWRIRNPEVREDYAVCIAAGVKQFLRMQ